MDLSLAPKQLCQMRSQREFCKSKLLPLFSLLLSFTELAILQTLQSPLSTQTIPSFSLLLSFTELAISRPRYISHNGRMYSLASISSRGATQTFEECKAWPGLDILATLEKYMAWPAYPAQVSQRHWRNTKPAPGLDILDTIEECTAWPAYPAEVPPRHLRNTKPGQA